MSKIISIKDYKLAKIVVDDLEKVIKVVDLTIQGLSYFKKYNPVAQIISSLQTNRTVLEINYQKYKRILDKKEQ